MQNFERNNIRTVQQQKQTTTHTGGTASEQNGHSPRPLAYPCGGTSSTDHHCNRDPRPIAALSSLPSLWGCCRSSEAAVKPVCASAAQSPTQCGGTNRSGPGGYWALAMRVPWGGSGHDTRVLPFDRCCKQSLPMMSCRGGFEVGGQCGIGKRKLASYACPSTVTIDHDVPK